MLRESGLLDRSRLRRRDVELPRLDVRNAARRPPASSQGPSALHHHDRGDRYYSNHQHKRCETTPAAAAAASASVTWRWWWGSRPPEAAAPWPRSGKAAHAGSTETSWTSWSWSESKHRLLLSPADNAPSLVVRLGMHFSLQLSPCAVRYAGAFAACSARRTAIEKEARQSDD